MTNKLKKTIISSVPYVFIGLFATKLGQAWRLTSGDELGTRILELRNGFLEAMQSPLPSFYPLDLLVGLTVGLLLRLIVYERSKNAKKYRRNVEYGSARWGKPEDIAPYIDPDFRNNVILTKTERLTMNSRPKNGSAVAVSAKNGAGIDELVKRLEKLVLDGKTDETFIIPNAEQGAVSRLYAAAKIIDIDYGAQNVTITATVDHKTRGQFDRYRVRKEGERDGEEEDE